MEHVRTVREPKQAIPTFAQTIELLMRPENRHVTFNVSFGFVCFFGRRCWFSLFETDRSTPLAAKVESRPPGGAFLFFTLYQLPFGHCGKLSVVLVPESDSCSDRGLGVILCLSSDHTNSPDQRQRKTGTRTVARELLIQN
jgi:hypothetical protein